MRKTIRQGFDCQSLFVGLILVTSFFIGMPVFGQTSQASIASGVRWLQSQVNTNGTLITEASSVGTPFQAREETLATLANLATAPNALIGIVEADTDTNTEYMARRVVALSGAGQTDPLDIAALEASQNADGGWGLTTGYQSDPLDTSLTLLALRAASVANSGFVSAATTYLTSAELADSGWGIGTSSSVYLTAQVLLATQSWADTVDVSSITATATAWLVGQQSGGSYADTLDNAWALMALSTQSSQSGNLSPIISTLITEQSGDGSWLEDPYLTAVALRGLDYAQVGDPQQGSVIGTVVDGAVGYPVANIPLTIIPIAGGTPITGTTAGDGSLMFGHLSPGQYFLQIAIPDFVLFYQSFAVAAGEQFNLGNLVLEWSTAPTDAIIRGIVVDATTGDPLPGVTVSTGSFQAITDAQGRYEIVDLPPAAYNLTATLTGYITEFASVTFAAGNIENYSPHMTPGAVQPTSGRIFGQATLASNGSPIQIEMIPFPGTEFATNVDGTYSLNTPPGSYSLLIPSNWGNDSITVSYTIVGNEQINYLPKLYAGGHSPANANTGEALLHVVDANSGAPISGAGVDVDEYSGSWSELSTLTTDDTGLVDITGIASDTIRLTIADARYSPDPLIMYAHVPLLQRIDLGDVGMIADHYALQTFSDLRVDTVDTSGLLYDSPGTGVSGALNVTIGNHGKAPTSTWFNVIAFFDLDGNDTYSAGDQIVGTARISSTIAPNTTTLVSVPVSGTANFSHAPVKIFIDPEGRLNELTNWNNIGSSAAACSFVPNLGTGQPVLKWQRTGTEIMNVPVVAPLLDTNGDGVVDELDKRAVIVVTFSSSVDSGSGTVRALDAETGEQLWEVDDPMLQARASGHIAVGDIDGDGKPEVVYYRSPDNNVVVLDNQGHLKWTAPYPTISGGYNYYGPELADLDEDGNPAVLVAGAALNNDGSVRFTYPVSWAGAEFQAIDLNLSGHQDIVVGNRAYDTSGSLLWTASIPNYVTGSPTRLSLDPHPTMFASYGNGFVATAYAVSNTGQQLWQTAIPVAYGNASAPTVGDTSGDGMPQIGIVTDYQYVVLNGDGSVLWTANIGDDSGATSAAMFDFSGDGHMDVVYANNNEFRVMDGRDGHTIYSLPHGSDTASEYPVVADIDRSGHASVLVVGDETPNEGLSVYGPPAGGIWPGARQIWNQYAYNMDNINDDGSIPVHPGYSWLEHNTFRANVVHFPNAMADLEVDGVAVIDNGYGNLPTLNFRVGNAGLRAPPRETFVDAYLGDPMSGGVSIAHDRLRLIPAGTATTFTFPNVSVATGDTLYLYADQADTIEECNKTNNTDIVTVQPANALATLGVSTDTGTYAPGATLTATATVQNTGALTNNLQVHLWVADMGGAVVADLGTQMITGLAGNGSSMVSATWPVLNVISGSYQLQGTVLPGAGGSPVAQTSSIFTISAQIPVGTIALNVATTQQTYATTQSPESTYTVVNASANAIWTDAHVHLQVLDAGSTVVFDHDYDLGQVVPGDVMEGNTQALSIPLPAGTYSVNGTLRDGLAGAVFANGTASFVVTAQVAALLHGTATVSSTQATLYQSVMCSVSLTDQGPDPINAQPVRFGIRGLTNGVLNSEIDATATLTSSSSWSNNVTVPTATLGLGPQSCVVEAEIDGVWTVIAYANFGVYYSTDLQTQIGARSPNLAPGQIQYYHVHVANAGPDTSTGATLSLSLPPQMLWLQASSSSPECVANGAQVFCSLPTLTSGQAVDMCLATRVLATAPMSVAAQATSIVDATTMLDPVPANDSAGIMTNIVPELLYADGFDPCWFQTDVIFVDGFEER